VLLAIWSALAWFAEGLVKQAAGPGHLGRANSASGLERARADRPRRLHGLGGLARGLLELPLVAEDEGERAADGGRAGTVLRLARTASASR